MAQQDYIEALERRLWSSADNLRANSNYASNEYFLPVMGFVFLRHAYSRYLAVKLDVEASLPGEVAGFSLHAGVATKANERAKLERLCRYFTRPAVSTKRLSITRNGRVRYELKTPWRNGTTHVIFEPLDFISRLVALVPKPRVNLTRFHGVFAPNSQYRSKIAPTRRGKRKKPCLADGADQTPAEKRVSMTWAKRLKRVFNIDIEICSECGGDVRIIASIEDPVVIQKILAYQENTAGSATTAQLPDCRASPCLPVGLFD